MGRKKQTLSYYPCRRARFYNAEGKEVKKADAVKVVPKGTVLQAEQKFSEKIDEFRTRKWLEEFKTELFDYLQMTKFDIDKEFAFETIGTKKVKSEEPEDKKDVMAARERNKFRAKLNAYLADESTPSKKEFCDYCNISPRMKYIPNSIIDDIRDKFANFKELYPINQKTAENGFESLTEPNNDTVPVYNSDYFADWSDAELENELECWKQDLERAETDLQKAEKLPSQANSSNVVLQDVARINRKELTEKYQNEKGNTLIEKIEHFIAFAKYCIRQLVDEIKVRKNVANSNLNYDYEKSEPEQNKEDDYEIEM